MNYTYCDQNRFENPNSYMYTPFGGAKFLTAYFANRSNAIVALQKAVSNEKISSEHSPDCPTHNKLLEIQQQIQCEEIEIALEGLEQYIRRFEVAKRLRNEYPVRNSTDLAPINTHILFYSILLDAYEKHQDIRYVNVMLKVGDTLISVIELLNLNINHQYLSLLIEREMQILETLMKRMDVSR